MGRNLGVDRKGSILRLRTEIQEFFPQTRLQLPLGFLDRSIVRAK
jgi:hypothetical protein